MSNGKLGGVLRTRCKRASGGLRPLVRWRVLLTAGRMYESRDTASIGTAITVTNGNIALCAGRDVILANTLILQRPHYHDR